MKTTIFTLAFAVIALFAANTVNAQSLDSYTAYFNQSTGQLSADGKVGGLGSKKRSVQVKLVANVLLVSECATLEEVAAGRSGRTITRHVTTEASTIVTLDKDLTINGRGFGTFNAADLITEAITGNACTEGEEVEGSTTKTFVSGYIEILGEQTWITNLDNFVKVE